MKINKHGIASLLVITASCFIVACGTESRKEAEKVKILPKDKAQDANTKNANETKESLIKNSTQVIKNNKVTDQNCLTKAKDLGITTDVTDQIALQLDIEKSNLLYEMIEYGQQNSFEDNLVKSADKNNDVLNKITGKTGKHLVCNLFETTEEQKTQKTTKCTLYFDNCGGKFFDWGYDVTKKIEGITVDQSKIKSLADNSLLFQYQKSESDKNKVFEALITIKDQEAEEIYSSLIAKEEIKDKIYIKSTEQLRCTKTIKDQKSEFNCLIKVLPSKGEILSIEDKLETSSTTGQERTK